MDRWLHWAAAEHIPLSDAADTSPDRQSALFSARGRIWRFVREDYFAVPEILARRRECGSRLSEAP
jgi:hypothetical protein